MKLDEYKKKGLAWLNFFAQIINALIVVANNIPASGNVTELFSNGQQPKVSAVNIAIGVALALTQTFLPRVQRRRL